MRVEGGSQLERTGLGVVLVLVGVAIGWLWPRPEPAPEDARQVTAPDPRLVAGTPTDAVTTDLPVLALELSEDAARSLTTVRERALARGLIVQEEDDLVPARVRLAGGAPIDGRVRIKGDWTDHVAGERWSLRVELTSDKLLGMRVFSIQDPATRGFLWEWVVHRAMQREGVLAPRGTFVDVTINGNPWGVYYLEEHFSKELLESQGRREGPIVLWDESAMWNAQLEAHHVPPTGVAMDLPKSLAPAPESGALGAEEAFPRAFGEKRLRSVESLASALDSALEKLGHLSDGLVVDDDTQSRLRRLEALARTQGETVERLVDVELLARHHALASLFQLEHPLAWHNMRFYHDPVRDRLEPISFDNMAHEPGPRDPVPLRARGVAKSFGASERYVAAVYRELARVASPDWLGAFLADVRVELERFEAALEVQAPLAPSMTRAGIQERLFRQAGWLQAVLDPTDPLQTDARFVLEVEGDPTRASTVHGTAWVDAWASVRTPLVVEGVRFSNGRVLFAASLAPEGAAREGSGVLLPSDGRRVRFTFELDRRLANLSNLDALLGAVAAAAEPEELDLAIDLLWRPAGATEPRVEPLRLRRRDPRWAEAGGRPDSPTVAEALRSHPFLRYAVDSHALHAGPGVFDVAGDLVLPRGAALVLEPGTTLRFAADALLLAEGPLRFRGTADAPVVLEPRAGADRFRGLLVLDAEDRSEWTYAVVRRTDAIERGGWRTTGGVTFYHSAVTLTDCAFEETFAEDGLNLFGCDVALERCRFTGCASDSFDGDFVTGTLTDCRFEDGLADGADFSGSDVELVGCVFADLADKGISVGEDSVVQVRGGRAERVSIGVASKDRSRAIVRDFWIRDAKLFGLAAFVKKAEFGPSELFAERVRIEGDTPKPVLAQTGCKVVVDGQVVPTEPVDVEALYREAAGGR